MSSNFSRANDHLMQAISLVQLALDEAQRETSKRHTLAIQETRITGLIDAVKYETRIYEVLSTLRGIRESPGLGIPARGFIPTSERVSDIAATQLSIPGLPCHTGEQQVGAEV